MMWYMIWWYDIWYDIYDMIYDIWYDMICLTAIGLTPDGSNTYILTPSW
jgi:hypothetical protein